jgi:outer membrane protein assembly factor BamD (BamD/ComL family)
MKYIFTLIIVLAQLTISFAQEKKIKKAINALNENKYEECLKYISEFREDSPESPLIPYTFYLYHIKSGSPSYNLEKAFINIQIVNNWLKTNASDKGWCKSYGLCSENILLQIDSLAMSALRFVEANKNDQAYKHFIETYTNTSINELGIQSFHHWKFEFALSINTIVSLETFINQFPNAQDIPNAKKKLEDLEYNSCKTSNEIPLIDSFIKKYPNSERKKEAQQLIFELEFKKCNSINDKNCLLSFEKKYPSSKYSSEIKNKIEDIDFLNVKKSYNKEILDAFIRDYPNSKYLDEIKKKLDELVNGVVIVTTGQGNSEDDARQSALRSAIEQTFGAFISSKTDILNDEIVSDQITSLSSGNIKSFEIINTLELPNGGYSTTLKSIVSIDKLTSFVQSKGVQVEFKGGLFAMNVKQQLLNEKAEMDIVTNVVGTVHNLLQQSFDYSLDVSEPKSKDGDSYLWEVPMLIKVVPNKNIELCYNYLKSNLISICLSKEEKSNYNKLNKPVYELLIKFGKNIDTIYLRTKDARESFDRFLNLWFYTHSFYIDNGQKKLREVGVLHKITKPGSPVSYPQRIPIFEGNKIELIPLNSNEFQIIYEYTDELTLENLEKINTYAIHQDTIRNEFLNGGYRFKNNKTDIIIAPEEIDIKLKKTTDGHLVLPDFKEIMDSILNAVNGKNYLGYNNWRIITKEETEAVLDNFYTNTFDNNILTDSKTIITSTEEVDRYKEWDNNGIVIDKEKKYLLQFNFDRNGYESDYYFERDYYLGYFKEFGDINKSFTRVQNYNYPSFFKILLVKDFLKK